MVTIILINSIVTSSVIRIVVPMAAVEAILTASRIDPSICLMLSSIPVILAKGNCPLYCSTAASTLFRSRNVTAIPTLKTSPLFVSKIACAVRPPLVTSE
ncbi:hypothetical protein D3C76_1258290 [compost metagenome]